MTERDSEWVEEIFEKYKDSDFLEFKKIENPEHPRADICAFLILDRLSPGNGDIVAGADHDIIYLDGDLDDIAKVATEEDLLRLIRCGVIVQDGYFAMYV